MSRDEDLKFLADLPVCGLYSEEAYCAELFEHMICGTCPEAEDCRRRFAEWHTDND